MIKIILKMKKLLTGLLLLSASTSSVTAETTKAIDRETDMINIGFFLGAARTACLISEFGYIKDDILRAFLDGNFTNLEPRRRLTALIFANGSTYMTDARKHPPCKDWLKMKSREYGAPTSIPRSDWERIDPQHQVKPSTDHWSETQLFCNSHEESGVDGCKYKRSDSSQFMGN